MISKIRKYRSKLFSEIRLLHKRISRIYGKEILVLGDSHADAFNHPVLFLRFPFLYFNVNVVQGATASGLENPNSKTQAYGEFSAILSKFTGDKVILLLGEVDTGFVIWYRAKKYSESISKTVKFTEDVYKRFIDDIARKFNLIIISCPLPTLEDGAVWGDVASARKEITATQQERTQLAQQFNKSIQMHCESKNIHYINLDQDSLGDDGFVKKDLLNQNPLNHHYDQKVYAKLLAGRLAKVLLP